MSRPSNVGFMLRGIERRRGRTIGILMLRDKSARFTTTRWGLISRAAKIAPSESASTSREDEPPPEAMAAEQALAELCEQYWYPVYAFIRRRRTAEEALDLTQKFLLRLIEKNAWAQADPNRGRFRSWLLGALQHFLANEWDYEHAAKRDRERTMSFDPCAAERRYAAEPRSDVTPECLYDRAFSLCVLERAIARLETEFDGAGRRDRFEVLKRFLPGSALDESAQAPLAASMGVTPNHFRKLVHDARARFRILLDAEIADLLDPSVARVDPKGQPMSTRERIAQERNYLASALSLPKS